MKKRAFTLLLTVLVLCLSGIPVYAAETTRLTVTVPRGTEVAYTASDSKDSFGVAVGYELGDGVSGLSAYVITVRWDPTVLKLRTDYRPELSDEDMLYCCGCYFEDLYEDGLDIVTERIGNALVNYRKVSEGVLTIACVGAKEVKDKQAILFLLDFLPVRSDCETVISAAVSEEFGMASDSGIIKPIEPRATALIKVGKGALPGDADGNGTVDRKDCDRIRLILQRKIASDDAMQRLADVNRDGRVTLADYLMVRRMLRK